MTDQHSDWAKEILRFLLAGLLAAAIGGIAGGWVFALVGGAVGLGLAFGIEWVIGLRSETRRLQDIERRLHAQERQHKAEKAYAAWQLECEKVSNGINAAFLEAYGGAQLENEKAGAVVVDSATILNRGFVIQKANGFDRVVPQPDLGLDDD